MCSGFHLCCIKESIVQCGIRHFVSNKMRTLFMGKYYSSFKFYHYALVESIRKETANKTQRISRKQFKIIVKMYSRWIHFPALISQHLHPYILYLKGKLCLVQYCKRISSLRRSFKLSFVTYVFCIRILRKNQLKIRYEPSRKLHFHTLKGIYRFNKLNYHIKTRELSQNGRQQRLTLMRT